MWIRVENILARTLIILQFTREPTPLYLPCADSKSKWNAKSSHKYMAARGNPQLNRRYNQVQNIQKSEKLLSVLIISKWEMSITESLLVSTFQRNSMIIVEEICMIRRNISGI